MPKRTLLERFADGEDMDPTTIRNELRSLKLIRPKTWSALVKPVKQKPPPTEILRPFPTDFPHDRNNLKVSYATVKDMLKRMDPAMRYSPDAHVTIDYLAGVIYYRLLVPILDDFYAKLPPELARFCRKETRENDDVAQIVKQCGPVRGRILSYLLYEILDASIRECKDRRRKVITHDMVEMGIRKDKDMLDMFINFSTN